jgi:hypothetical protein
LGFSPKSAESRQIKIEPFCCIKNSILTKPCVENHCRLWLMLDTRFWILDGFDGTIRALLVIEHPVSSIEYLLGKFNYQEPTCISS